jgi:hypothetical protein
MQHTEYKPEQLTGVLVTLNVAHVVIKYSALPAICLDEIHSQ